MRSSGSSSALALAQASPCAGGLGSRRRASAGGRRRGAPRSPVPWMAPVL